MQDHDPDRTPPFWRCVSDLMFGRLYRRVRSLEVQLQKLDDRISELERQVARQDGKLKALTNLLPAAVRRLAEAETQDERSDPPTMH